jgi:hypothetical protein
MAAGLHGNSGARIAEPTEFHNQFAESSFDYSTLPADIGIEAQAAAVRIKEHLRGAIIGVGAELFRMKERLPHGEFGKWIKAEFALTERTAQNYMAAAELVAKYEIISVLKPTTIYQLAARATPESARQAVIEQLTAGQMIGNAQVKQAIDAAKAEQAADWWGNAEDEALAKAKAEARRPAPAPAPKQPERVEDAIDLTRLMALATNPELFSQAERDAGVQEYARRLGVKISIAEADDQPVEEVEIDDAGERKVEQDTVPPAVIEVVPAPAPIPAGNGKDYAGTKPPFPCNKPNGICGYAACAPQGRCLQLAVLP